MKAITLDACNYGRRAIAVVLLSLLVAVTTTAQTTGSIDGAVVDANGNPLPGVVVTGMSLALLKLSGDSVHDYATISDDSPSPSCASRARSAATS